MMTQVARVTWREQSDLGNQGDLSDLGNEGDLGD